MMYICVWCRYLDRIIRSSELHEFSEMLQLHQKALTADGLFRLLFLCLSFTLSLSLFLLHVGLSC